jgi:chromosome segregation ATPase
MNPADQPAVESVDAPQAAPVGRTNPHLTANLRADYDAIRNDLEQAQQLAADFQRQAADKSNESAHIRRLLEKTKADLTQLEAHVSELRLERHRLANDLMIAAATELELRKVKKDREQLRTELESLTQATMTRINALQAHVIEQQREIEKLEAAAKGARSTAGGNDAGMEKINDLTATVARLTSLMEGHARRENSGVEARKTNSANGFDDDIINLSFER